MPNISISKEKLIVLLDNNYFNITQSATASLISLIRSCEVYRNIAMNFKRYADEPICFKCVKNRLYECNLLNKEERNILDQVFQVRNYLVHNVILFVQLKEMDKNILKNLAVSSNDILKRMVYRENFPSQVILEKSYSELHDKLIDTKNLIGIYDNMGNKKEVEIRRKMRRRPIESLNIE